MREQPPVDQPEIQINENTDFEDEMIDEGFINIDEEEVVRDESFYENRSILVEQIMSSQDSLLYVERHQKLVDEFTSVA